MKSAIFAAAAWCGWSVAMLTGCCHAEYTLCPAPEEIPAPAGYRAAVTGSAVNSGYYLFDRWALYAGNMNRPNSSAYTAFRDNVRPDRNTEMLQNAMRRHYHVEKLEQVEHQEQSWGYFSLWLVWRRSITTTAVGLERLKEKKNAAAGQTRKND